MKDGFGPSSDPGIGTVQASGDAGLPAGTKAGIVVAVIGGILLGLLVAFGIFYWRRQKKSRNRYSPLIVMRRVEAGVAAVQVPETRYCESEPYYTATLYITDD